MASKCLVEVSKDVLPGVWWLLTILPKCQRFLFSNASATQTPHLFNVSISFLVIRMRKLSTKVSQTLAKKKKEKV